MHGYFIWRKDVFHSVLALMKIFIFILLKTKLVVGCILVCFIFCLLFFSSILRHHPELRYFYSGEVYSWNQIRVLPSGNVVIIILQYHLLLLQYFFIIQDTLGLFIREFSLHWDRYHWVIFYHSSLNSGKMFGCIGMPHSE